MEPDIIFDGHNDSLLQLHFPERGGGRTFFRRSERGHLDLPRAREGGFGGGMFAVFVPAPSRPEPPGRVVGPVPGTRPPIEAEYAREVTDGMITTLRRVEEQSSGQVRIARTVQEVLNYLQAGVLAAVLHFEGAEAIEPDLSNLEAYHARGLRSLGIVWARPNAFGHGAPLNTNGSADVGPGLTEAGKALVRACNRLRILIDTSHLNEKGFRDVALLSKAPLVATHSNAHAVCPSARNLTDEQLRLVRDSGGIVGISLSVADLRPDVGDDADMPIEIIVRHMEHMVKVMGIDHVGIGCDLDGCKIPCAIGDVTGLPRILAALRAHGFDAESIRKFAHANWLRVLERTWE